MADILCFYRNRYFIWSTVVDAPTTYGMTERECVQWLSLINNISGFGHAAAEMVDAQKSGTNSELVTLDTINSHNRAGYREGYLTLDEIYQIYCVEQRVPSKEDAKDPR